MLPRVGASYYLVSQLLPGELDCHLAGVAQYVGAKRRALSAARGVCGVSAQGASQGREIMDKAGAVAPGSLPRALTVLAKKRGSAKEINLPKSLRTPPRSSPGTLPPKRGGSHCD
jgi:hypothetical protein